MSPMLWYGRLTKEGGDMKLTIDRNVWLRGEGNGVSFLLREVDRKMCCVGIYLKACGILENECEVSRVPGT